MKQVLQSYRTGELRVADVPAPRALPGTLLVQTHASLLSAGTERMVMALAQKSLLGKAAERPDLVQKVKDKLARDGLWSTAQAVLSKLDEPVPLGYSLSGIVVDRGEGVTTFAVGERVVCAGAKLANHAELNAVPQNLCAKIPAGVSDEVAAFATVGAIALQGVRTATLTLGERVAVIGLGLIGQLAIQLCRAQGCRVMGIDLDSGKVELAKKLGADVALVRSGPVMQEVASLTQGRGVDAVLICAAADSDDPIHLAGELARDRARVVVVGAVPMNVPRRPYYDKELTLLQSRSYGPGRYDPTYEEHGIDYPFGYVRWTEGRNLGAFLEMCALGQLKIEPLITHRFAIDDAESAYRLLMDGTPSLGLVLTYPKNPAPPVRMVEVAASRGLRSAEQLGVSLLGSGSFATGTLVPELARRKDIQLQTVVSARGVSARHAAERFKFQRCATDETQVFEDPNTDAVVIATRHDLHPSQASRALRAGKAVFLEKPLAIDRPGVEEIVAAAKASHRILFVDFNRRFAPLTRNLIESFTGRSQPMTLLYRVHAGVVPKDSWIHDPKVGGGRIVGEVCHFVDLCSAIVGAEVQEVFAESVAGASGDFSNEDQVSISLKFTEGSLATIVYASGGAPSLPKERLEVMCEGRTAILDDFRRLEVVERGKRRRFGGWTRDKGHRAALDTFVQAVRSGRAGISLRTWVAATVTTFAIVESQRSGARISVQPLLNEVLGTSA